MLTIKQKKEEYGNREQIAKHFSQASLILMKRQQRLILVL